MNLSNFLIGSLLVTVIVAAAGMTYNPDDAADSPRARPSQQIAKKKAAKKKARRNRVSMQVAMRAQRTRLRRQQHTLETLDKDLRKAINQMKRKQNKASKAGAGKR